MTKTCIKVMLLVLLSLFTICSSLVIPPTSARVNPTNMRPIIGILAQEPGRYMRRALAERNESYSCYVAASYVKSVESAGARVVPIKIDQATEYYEMMAQSLNGFLFPGGGAKITNESGYGRAGDILYQHILASQNTSNTLPLWATCLSFEMLLYLAGGKDRNPLTPCKASGRADPLHFANDFKNSQLFRTASWELIVATANENITSNFHKYCVLPETFTDMNIDVDYKVLSTNYDDDGVEYVSTVEHRQYPIYATQWHPEKPAYEWSRGSIPHTNNAMRLNNHLMEVFVNEARKNGNSFPSDEEEEKHLIYNHSPTYVSQMYDSSFQQCYFF